MKRLAMATLAASMGIASIVSAASAVAAEWPERPIRLFVAGAAGGASDTAARLVSSELSKDLGQSIVIENRPGAGGIIAMKAAADAKSDGYTLTLVSAATATTVPWTQANVPYDVQRDFTPIGMVIYTPIAIAVKADSPYQSFSDLLAAARAKPDSIVMANPGVNTLAHLTAELIASRAKTKIRTVPFRGFPGSLSAVINGDVTAVIDGVAPMPAQAKSGTIRILAVSSADRLPGLEAFPLVHDAIPGTDVLGWFGLFGPAGLPESISNRLSKSLHHVMANPELLAKFQAMGMYPRADTPASFKAYIAEQSDQWKAVITANGIEKK